MKNFRNRKQGFSIMPLHELSVDEFLNVTRRDTLKIHLHTLRTHNINFNSCKNSFINVITCKLKNVKLKVKFVN